MIKKGDLPVKTCVICERPFSWRKKWAKDWDAVQYCSKACRQQRRAKSFNHRQHTEVNPA